MKFQYIFLSFFGLMAVISVIVFSQQPDKAPEDTDIPDDIRGTITIWGTFDPTTSGMTEMQSKFNQDHANLLKINYQYHDPKTFDQDITEALAAEIGPDVLILPDDLVLRHSNKLTTITNDAFPQRKFLDTFVDAAEVYLRPDGIIAVPFAIDPMVMYWNRDLYASASLVSPPAKWDELLLMVPQLTKRDRNQNLVQSAVALGEYVNVYRAKDILATMFLQLGNPIVELKGTRPVSTLSRTDAADKGGGGVRSALVFFTDFINPMKSTYTWSRARGNSRDEFIDGSLAMYFDTASAYRRIALSNPHLNFDVAPMPQPRDATHELTGAKIYGLSVLKSSKNQKAAFEVIKRLLDPKYSEIFSSTSFLPPVRRDLLQKGAPGDAVLSVFYKAAIQSRVWLDPKPAESDVIFREMVESVSSGSVNPQASVTKANARMNAILEVYAQPLTKETPQILPGY